MKIEIQKSALTDRWLLAIDGRLSGSCKGSFSDAVYAFGANWPEIREELDQLLCEDLTGPSGKKAILRPANGSKTPPGGTERPKKGSGARFRALILAGKSNQEALAIVKKEFPQSKATLADAAWHRGKLKKNGFISES